MIAVLALVVASCGTDGQGVAAPANLVPGTSVVEKAQRDPFLWPFTADSPWNTPVGTKATFKPTDSPETVALLDSTIETWVNSDEFSHPIVRASTSDPVLTVKYDNGGQFPPAAGEVRLHVPLGAKPAIGVDAHLHVVDPDGLRAHEFYEFKETSTGATATYYVISDLTGSGIGEGGTRAYGGSAIGGLMRSWEVDEGLIRHALAIALLGRQLKRGPVWPANEEDSSAPATYTGTIPIGTLIAIPRTVDVGAMPLTPAGMSVARALQNYGAYVVDQADAMTLYAEPDVSLTHVAAMREDFRTIRRELRIVSNNGPASVGGGGEPIAPLAPPFR